MENVENALVEEQDGLAERAMTRGSAFRLSAKRECEGNPKGKLQPECIGEEILDVKNKTWYKSVGPTSADWIPLH